MKFENVLNWGQVLTLVVMGAGGLFAFAKLQAESGYLREAIQDVRRETDAYDIRLRALELGFGRVEERLVSIQGDIQRLLQNQNQGK